MRPFNYIHLLIVVAFSVILLSLAFVYIFRRAIPSTVCMCPSKWMCAFPSTTSGMASNIRKKNIYIFAKLHVIHILKSVFIFICRSPRLKRITIHFMAVFKSKIKFDENICTKRKHEYLLLFCLLTLKERKIEQNEVIFRKIRI